MLRLSIDDPAHRVLGTAVHEGLERFYKQWVRADAEGEERRDRLAASLAAAIGKTGDQSFRNPFLRALRARQPRPGSGQSGQDQRLYRAALDAFARIDAIKVNPEDEWRALLRHF